MPASKKKIGLALGGGGARGIAHLGVLYILEKYAIPVDMISGTSIGALIAAMYAHDPDVRTISRKFFESQESPEYKALKLDRIARNARKESVFKHIKGSFANYYLHHSMGFLKRADSARFLETLLDGMSFDTLQIPCALVAANISKGTGASFTEGDLLKSVQASMSLPMWMEPVEIDGDLYVDGIGHDVVPTRSLREMGADTVIAVDVSLRETHPRVDNAIDVKYIADKMAVNRSIDLSLEYADIVIRPDTQGLMWYDFHRSPRLIRAGREAAELHIPGINKLL
ncbi:MAG: patatin-like phospholipase family protein [Candidatus Marinimicrobia bacterium]|nr:patatin-like phospholipase family protein [Candidatus Neomarinimicrobiota bacterium]